MKEDVEEFLQLSLIRHHWQHLSLTGLPRAFVRDVPVTPAFLYRIVRRSQGIYLVSGHVGLLSQEFERSWLISHPGSDNRFCFLLHVSNIPEISGKISIDITESEDQLIDFCESITSILERFPHDAKELKLMFSIGSLLGIPVEKFKMYGQEQKFSHFRDFFA